MVVDCATPLAAVRETPADALRAAGLADETGRHIA
jgi:hypothetical protein